MKRRTSLFLIACAALPCALAAAEFDAASATNQVGLDLFRQLATAAPDQNLVVSPYSIESALALAFAGADGATRAEMARALYFPTDDTPIQPAFARLRAALDPAVPGSPRRSPEDAGSIEWHSANRLYGQRGYDIHTAFLDELKTTYAAPFELLDFAHHAESARGTINAWVEAQTNGKIAGLIPRTGIDDRTRLVLVNALYLKAPWATAFPQDASASRPFHLPAGSPRDVPTMHRTGFLGYAREDGFVVVSLDYIGGGLQFLILLPDEGTTTDAIAAKVTTDRLARWAALGAKTPPTDIALWLPRFRVDGATVALGGALRARGLKSAFDEPRGSANFERIAVRRPNDYLALAEVYHRTFIVVDETGTEAAAATGGIVLSTFGVSAEKPIEVHVDRPFLFAIQHRASGTCLFLGRIADPR